MKQLRIAIYARVSTDDKGQDPLNQLLQLRAFAQRTAARNRGFVRRRQFAAMRYVQVIPECQAKGGAVNRRLRQSQSSIHLAAQLPRFSLLFRGPLGLLVFTR
jgi:hypothetical protein